MENVAVGNRILLGDGGTGQNDIFELNNTKYLFLQVYDFNNRDSILPWFKIKGLGNSYNPIVTPVGFKYELDETEKLINSSATTILKGTPVKKYTFTKVVPMVNGDLSELFYGIALEDILPNAKGIIQRKGYISNNVLGLTVSTGDKIGVVNGLLAVVTENTIGRIQFSLQSSGDTQPIPYLLLN